MICYRLYCQQCDAHASTLPTETVITAIDRWLIEHEDHIGVHVAPPGAPEAGKARNILGALDG